MKYQAKHIVRAVLCAAGAALAVLHSPKAEAAPHTHDGFYLEITAGLGYLSSSADEGAFDQKLSGISLPSSLLLGGSLIPGLVLGGSLATDYAPSPSLSSNGRDLGGDFSMYLFSIGPFVDFYPDPTKGLHFQGMVGWGGLETSVNGDSGGSDPTGVVMSVAGGYEWWVGQEWSIGALARIAYAPLSLHDVGYTTIAPALLASFTYH